MSTPHKPDNLAILQQELAAGLRTGLELELAMDISGPTLSRLLGRMGDKIDRIGAARSTRYGLRRPVRNLGDAWPIFVVGQDSQVRELGTLRALHGAFHFLPAGAGDGKPFPCISESVSPRLPFFLTAARPGGYLGRHIARRFSERSIAPKDVRDWADDDLLEYFITAGTDLPGNVLVGETAKAQAMRKMATARSASLAEARTRYPDMIASAHESEIIGSSADGEQPKFLATVDGGVAGSHRSLIIKFSPPVNTPAGRRWADLLVCEHLAATTINRTGGIAAANEVFFGHGRCFLESERFDRTPGLGRVGVVGLGVVIYAVAGRGADDWGQAATLLEGRGLLPASDAQAIRWARCFGGLIGNEDMHEANAALFWERANHFRFAPIYDMLPMLYRPNEQGEVASRAFRPTSPDADTNVAWSSAAKAACDFWEAVSNDQRVSLDMRQEAARNAAKVAHLSQIPSKPTTFENKGKDLPDGNAAGESNRQAEADSALDPITRSDSVKRAKKGTTAPRKNPDSIEPRS